MTHIAKDVLNLKWDDALRLVLQTDSYYHRPAPKDGSTTTTAAAAEPPTFAGRVRQYFVRSSKTRLCVQGCLTAYVLWAATHPSRTVSCSVTVTGLANPAPRHDPAATPSLWETITQYVRGIVLSGSATSQVSTITSCYLYQSSEGLQLLMKAPMPTVVFVAHAVSGMLLIPLTWAQKESVSHMRFTKETSGVDAQRAHTVEEKKAALQQARRARQLHSVCGISTVVCMALMTVGGVAMRCNSLFAAESPAATTHAISGNATEAGATASASHPCPRDCGIDFGKAIIGFAMPWGVFIPAIAASAKLQKVVPHAVVGGLICKACVAVPLARVLGGVYQRLLRVHVALPSATAVSGEVSLHVEQAVMGELERAYYAGIASATVVIGVWAALDTYKLVRAAREDVAHGKPSLAQASRASAPRAANREEL